MKVGSKPRLLTCISNITLSLPSLYFSESKRELNFCNGYLSLLYFWECSFESFARKRQKRTEAKFWQTKSQKYVLETFHHSCFSLLWKVCGVSLHPCDITHALESVQDFLIKLDMKPCMHQEEISIFSLNHVILRLAKIMNSSHISKFVL